MQIEQWAEMLCLETQQVYHHPSRPGVSFMSIPHTVSSLYLFTSLRSWRKTEAETDGKQPKWFRVFHPTGEIRGSSVVLGKKG